MDNEEDNSWEAFRMDEFAVGNINNLNSVPPTLQSIAIMSVAINLWMQPDVIEEIPKDGSSYSNLQAIYPKLKDKLLKKLDKLFLPYIMKTGVSNAIRPIGMQLVKWYDGETDEHCSLQDLRALGCSIYWTREGTIDRIKSIGELIKNRNQEKEICCLYELACQYCLEEYIIDLWEEIPPEKRREYNYIYKYRSHENHIVAYWTLRLNNELARMVEIYRIDNRFIYNSRESIFRNMISCSVDVGNPFSLRYFWKKSTEQKRNVNIRMWIEQVVRKLPIMSSSQEYLEYNPHVDIFCFLLSQLNDPIIQKEIFRARGNLILLSMFRSWPFQKYFLPTILSNNILNYTEEHSYVSVMTDIANNITEGSAVKNFFKEIWKVSPENLKKVFLGERNPANVNVTLSNVVIEFVKDKDIDSVIMILSDVSAERKKFIARSCMETEICELDFSELNKFFKAAFPSDTSLQVFKQEVIQEYGFVAPIIERWIEKGNFRDIDAFLEWTYQSKNQIQNFKKDDLNPFELYFRLIHLDDYNCINEFLNWYFDTDEEIRKFKEDILTDEFSLVDLLFVFQDEYREHKLWDLFIQFVNHSSFVGEEMIEFKKKCVKNVAEVIRNPTYLEFASAVLNWCFDTAEEVVVYKNEYALSLAGLENLLKPYCSCNDYFSAGAKQLISWLSPLSKETVTSLKLRISSDAAHDQRIMDLDQKAQFIFELLDRKAKADLVSEFGSNFSNTAGVSNEGISDNNAGNESVQQESDSCNTVKVNETLKTGLVNFASVPPTLKHIARVFIAIKLWTQSDVVEEISQSDEHFFNLYENTTYPRLKEKLLNKLNRSHNSVKTEVSDVIRPIGAQLFKWFDSEEHRRLQGCSDLGHSIFWSVDGTIDKIKILKDIITDENSDKDYLCLYELACEYCLEEHIFSLWEKIPSDQKNEFSHSFSCRNHMSVYWELVQNNEVPTNSIFFWNSYCHRICDFDASVFQNMISCSIYAGNTFSLKYFWKKLTEEEKNVNIEMWFDQVVNKLRESIFTFNDYLEYNPNTDILCFLLSHLNDLNKQTYFLKFHSEVVLESLFLSWPFQKVFLPTVLSMLNYITKDNYVSIMTGIARNLEEGTTPKKLFREIWKSSSPKLKKAFLDEKDPANVSGTLYELLIGLLKAEDIDMATMILSDASTEKKKSIISRMNEEQEFYELNFSVLDPFFKVAFPSDSKLQKFKQDLVPYAVYCEIFDKWIDESDYQRMEHFLKWAYQSENEMETFKRDTLSVNEIYIRLICSKSYTRLDLFLNWYFDTDEEEIRKFKNDFLNDASRLSRLLWEIGWKKENSWDLFNEFIDNSSFSSEEIVEFKKQCVKSVDELIGSHLFGFASTLLNWCSDAVDDVNRCKGDFVLTRSGLEALLHPHGSWNDFTLEETKELLQWLSPLSSETIAALKLWLGSDEARTLGIADLKHRTEVILELLDARTEEDVV